MTEPSALYLYKRAVSPPVHADPAYTGMGQSKSASFPRSWPVRYVRPQLGVKWLEHFQNKNPKALPPECQFIKHSGCNEFFMVPLDDVRGRFHGFVLRGGTLKKFHTLAISRSRIMLGGLWAFAGFRYGMPLIVVEGLKDVIAVQEFYPYAVATLGNEASVNVCKAISCLTNRVMVIRDNDKAGRQLPQRLRRTGLQVIDIPSPGHDPGDYFTDEGRVLVRAFLKQAVSMLDGVKVPNLA